MSYPELAALEGVIADIDALIASLSSDDWERPTRCAPMTVRDLVTHLGAGAVHAQELGPADARPTMGRSDFFRYDIGSAAEAVESARVEARTARVDAAARWRTFSKSFADLFTTNQPDAVIRSWDGGWMTLADLAVARGVVELGVHVLDLQDALGHPERMHALAEPIVTGVLDGLLGQPLPQELGWDPTTYALKGTGRAALNERDKGVLGELAASFPLFA